MKNDGSSTGAIVFIIVLVLLFWTIEAAVESFLLFPGTDFSEALFHPNLHSLWMRSLAIIPIILSAILMRIHLQRRRAEKQSQYERERLENIVEGIGGGLILLDSSLNITWANDIFQRWFGTEESIIGMSCPELFSANNTPGGCAGLCSKKSGKIEHGECHAITVSGDKRYFQITSVPKREYGGKVAGFVELIQDVTEKKVSETALQESEHKFHTLFNQASDSIFLLSPTENDLIIEDLNEAACRIHGYTRDELIGKSIGLLDDPETRGKLPEWVKTLTSGKRLHVESTHVRKDGSIFPVEIIAQLLILGEKTYILGIDRNISRRKKSELVLKESEERLKLALTASRQGLYDLDLRTGEAVVNAEYALMLGYDPSEFKESNQKWLDRLHPEDHKRVVSYYRSYVNGETDLYQVEFRQKTKSNDWKWILSLGKIVERDSEGNPIRMLGTHTDISGQKESERDLLERIQLAEMNADIGLALTAGKSLRDMLQGCTEAFVKSLDVLFARIWIYNETDDVLELRASAGLYTDIDGKHSRKLIGQGKIGMIAEKRISHLTNNVAGDPLVTDQEWVTREQVVGFAGHPLVIDERLVGVMALFSRHQLTDLTLKSLASVADIIALGIERKIVEEKVKAAAITDVLTGLFNRRGFFTLAEQQCKVADRGSNNMSLIFLDLDGFKNINDELGHKAGDQALRDTAHILTSTFRKSDIVARIGGDEFVVLITEPPDSHCESIILNNIKKSLNTFNENAGRAYEILFSIGLAHYVPRCGSSVSDLLSTADKNMYEDKKYHKILGTMTKMTKMRMYRRFLLRDGCQAELDISSKIKIVNISLGGVCLESSEPLTMNETYTLTLSPSRDEVTTFSGQAVWTRPKKDVSRDHAAFCHESGLIFTDISNTMKASLSKITGASAD